jgi:hypothetical protein
MRKLALFAMLLCSCMIFGCNKDKDKDKGKTDKPGAAADGKEGKGTETPPATPPAGGEAPAK